MLPDNIVERRRVLKYGAAIVITFASGSHATIQMNSSGSSAATPEFNCQRHAHTFVVFVTGVLVRSIHSDVSLLFQRNG